MRLRVYGEKEDINVQGWRTLHNNFSFVGMWEKIDKALKFEKEKPGEKSSWLKSYFSLSQTMFESGECEVDEHTMRCSIMYIDKEEPVNRNAFANGSMDETYLRRCTGERFFANNIEYITKIVDSNKPLTVSAFNMLWLILMLHVQSGVDMMTSELDRKENALELINRIVKNKNFKENDLQTAADVFVPEDMELLLLPGCDEEDIKCSSEIVCFYKESGIATVIELDKKVLLFPGEKVYAVRNGKGYVGILPQLAVDSNAYMLVENGKLTLNVVKAKEAKNNDMKAFEIEKIDMSAFVDDEPVSWCFNMEKDAIAVVGRNGRVVVGGYEKEHIGIENAIAVFGQGEIYSVLKADSDICEDEAMTTPKRAFFETYTTDGGITCAKSNRIRVYRTKENAEWICENRMK